MYTRVLRAHPVYYVRKQGRGASVYLWLCIRLHMAAEVISIKFLIMVSTLAYF